MTSASEDQIRLCQNDEYRALKECYPDLVDLRKLVKLSKSSRRRKRDKLWAPLEIQLMIQTQPDKIAEFVLHVKCTRKYPLEAPAIGFKDVKGISRALITKLHKQLKLLMHREDTKGQTCISLLIMHAQQFLDDHYHDLELNNKSFYDQMVDGRMKTDERLQMEKKKHDELSRIELERQREEVKLRILQKRVLYNESRKRRDSQNSTSLEQEIDDSVYDFEGDLEGDSVECESNSSIAEDCDPETFNAFDEEAEYEETVVPKRGAHISDGKSPITSRVDLEYEVIEELGHGGFGTVYKVKNRVDSRLYALKKVKLDPNNEVLNEKIMREVRLLSRLNHENVIRYYTAWSEKEIVTISKRTNSMSTYVESEDTSKIGSLKNKQRISKRKNSESSDDDGDDVYHTSYLINDRNIEKVESGELTENYVVFQTSPSEKDKRELVSSMKKSLKTSDKKLDSLHTSDNSDDDQDFESDSKKLRINTWLYIQMELGQGTLRQAIDRGLPKQKDRARRFFREILDGLCHIHRQGIIHRDLKPVNIFLDLTDRPKIGDFGLATTNLIIITQNSAPGVSTATKITPNRMSLEKLRLLASPEQNESSKSGKGSDKLKYIHRNQTDNIGTPLYMSPELSATSELKPITKVVYSHKVDVYSLGIIYFEMLYPFQTGHERIDTLQNLRKPTIDMPNDTDTHLTREEVELIRLLLTHDVSVRPTSEKLLTSNLLPSMGLKEREYNNIIKQVVQNRQARTHKHMLRLLFDQNDSYVDDFVFDFDESNDFTSIQSSSSSQQHSKSDSQIMLKDFGLNSLVLDQVKLKFERLLRSLGYMQFSAPTLMPKYSAAKYYGKNQIDDVVMLMDKNSSIVTLPYDLRLPFARYIARTNVSYMSRFALGKIFRQRQILGYHPDELWECCVDLIAQPSPPECGFQISDAEILALFGDVVRRFPAITTLRPLILVNNIKLVEAILSMLGIESDAHDNVLSCMSESLSISMRKTQSLANCSGNIIAQVSKPEALPSFVKEDLKRDLVASKLISNITTVNYLIYLLDMCDAAPSGLCESIENFYHSKNLKASQHLDAIKKILAEMDDTILYAQNLGLTLPIRVSPSFALNALRPIDFYSGLVCLLECKRHRKAKNKFHQPKSVILAVGGRYDRLIDKFARSRSEVLDFSTADSTTMSQTNNTTSSWRETYPTKTAIGVSFEVAKFARFALEDYIEHVCASNSVSNPTIHQLLSLNSSLFQTHNNLNHHNHQPQTHFSQQHHQFQSVSSSVSSTSGDVSLRYWLIDVAVCSLIQPKTRPMINAVCSLVKQLRDKGLICNEVIAGDLPFFSLSSMSLFCSENKIPFVVTLKAQSNQQQQSLDNSILSLNSSTNVHNSTSGDDSHAFLSISSTSSMSQIQQTKSASPIHSANSTAASNQQQQQQQCLTIAVLYQLIDRCRLREIKRCDLAGIVDFITKK